MGMGPFGPPELRYYTRTQFSFAGCFCPEKELERLVCHAVEENSYSQRLNEVLIKQSWDGNITFCMFSSKLRAVCRARR